MRATLAFLSAVLAALGLGLLAPPRRPRGARAPRLVRALARAGAPAARGAAFPAPRDLAARIEAAGRPGGLGERELMAAKVGSAIAGAAGGALLSASAPGRLGALALLAGPAAGFLAPDLWLARLAATRARHVRRELPAMLDLLRVAVEAGLSLPAALAEVGRRTHGPLGREWRALARETELGRAAGEAVEGSVRRLPLPEIRAWAAAIERALRHGAPLADTLAAQARDVRFALRRRIQEDAARAGPKIQLVVALHARAVGLAAGGGSSRGRVVAAHLISRAGVPPSISLYRAVQAALTARSDGKVGKCVARWGKVGYGAANQTGRSGGAPPTPPLRPTTLSGIGIASWRFGATTNIRWTRRTG